MVSPAVLSPPTQCRERTKTRQGDRKRQTKGKTNIIIYIKKEVNTGKHRLM